MSSGPNWSYDFKHVLSEELNHVGDKDDENADDPIARAHRMLYRPSPRGGHGQKTNFQAIAAAGGGRCR